MDMITILVTKGHEKQVQFYETNFIAKSVQTDISCKENLDLISFNMKY